MVTSNEGDLEAGTFALRSAPNPASAMATLSFDLEAASDVTVAVYDVLGREVDTFEAPMGVGSDQRVRLDVSALPSGVYVVRVRAESGADVRVATQRITVVR